AAGPVPAGARRLYLIDLRRGDRPAVVVDALRTLLQARRVVAVALTAPAASPRADVSRPAGAATADAAGKVVPAPIAEPLQVRPADSPGAPLQPRPLQPRPLRAAGAATQPSESDLDALVDGVNGNDW